MWMLGWCRHGLAAFLRQSRKCPPNQCRRNRNLKRMYTKQPATTLSTENGSTLVDTVLRLRPTAVDDWPQDLAPTYVKRVVAHSCCTQCVFLSMSSCNTQPSIRNPDATLPIQALQLRVLSLIMKGASCIGSKILKLLFIPHVAYQHTHSTVHQIMCTLTRRHMLP